MFIPSIFTMRGKSVIVSLLACCGSVIFLCCSSVSAAPVTEDMALMAAKSRIETDAVFKQAAAENGISFSISSISRLRLDLEGAAPAWKVSLSPRGYMIIAADDRMSPVMAYSVDHDLDLSPVPSNTFRYLIEADLRNIGRILRSPGFENKGLSEGMKRTSKRFEAHRRQWQKVLTGVVSEKGVEPRDSLYSDSEPETGAGPELLSDTDPVMGPLLGDLLWDQNNHYNELCPDDPDASSYYDGHMPTGCVATAAGQMMKYYNWPPYGTGSHSYSWNDSELAADFTDPFDWTLMKNSYDPWGFEPVDSEMAVSELLYELGVSVEMDYDHSGSAASIDAVNRALDNYFFYEAGVSHRDQDAFGALIQQEVEAGRPVLVGLTGHAVVIDGVNQSDSPVVFHVNYGWGGTNNGWYNLDNFPAGGAVSRIITGIEPVFTPLFDIPPSDPDDDGTFELSWHFPWFRRFDLTGFQLMEAGYVRSDFMDHADSLWGWHATEGWQTDPNGFDGQCFYVPPNLMGTFTLSFIDPFVPHAGAMINFYCKAIIIDAVLHVEVSADAGRTWQSVLEIDNDNASGKWDSYSKAIGGFAEKSLLMRFRIDATANPFYYYPAPTGGIRIDNIEIIGAEIPEWQMINSDIPADVNIVELSGRQNGIHLYRLLTCSEQGCGNPSPAVTVKVEIAWLSGDFDEDDDVDGADLAQVAIGEKEISIEELASVFGTVRSR